MNPASMILQDAVARRFTIIGEASAALFRKHPEFCEQNQQIPLRQARDLRNFIIHDYDGIEWDIIWDTAREDLPRLIKAHQEHRASPLRRGRKPAKKEASGSKQNRCKDVRTPDQRPPLIRRSPPPDQRFERNATQSVYALFNLTLYWLSA
ncbi:MAG: DUF86 domain-containing protein [Desulfovibrio sp.]|nr:DUF86 domain-containing protein [Desulfovibrio sp.]